MNIIILDTDVASRLQRGTVPEDQSVGVESCNPRDHVRDGRRDAQGRIKASWGSARLGRFESWLAAWPVLPYDPAVSRMWGRLVADREAVGSPIASNDAWVAACCVAAEVPLATLNRRHFEGISGLELVP